MSKQTVTVHLPIELEVMGLDGTRYFPSFYEDAATIGGHEQLGRIGRSVTSPFVFYLFTPEGADTSQLPNGSFVGTLNIGPAFHELAKQWESLTALAKAQTEAAPEEESATS